jgi:hypothetical protein
MGFTPAEINKMSMWEFLACRAGYAAAHAGPESVAPPTNEEHDALAARWAEL